MKNAKTHIAYYHPLQQLMALGNPRSNCWHNLLNYNNLAQAWTDQKISRHVTKTCRWQVEILYISANFAQKFVIFLQYNHISYNISHDQYIQY